MIKANKGLGIISEALERVKGMKRTDKMLKQHEIDTMLGYKVTDTIVPSSKVKGGPLSQGEIDDIIKKMNNK